MRNIRISVNSKCNLRCVYCHNEGQPSSHAEMTPEEIERIVRVAASLGIRKAKLTGGEPLCRDDITEVVKRTARHMAEVSLTTNGTLLADLAAPLKDAGLVRVNVSLDTVDRSRYREITGQDMVESVIAGIKRGIAVGLHPVKVNIVALPEHTKEEMKRTAFAVWDLGAIPQIIEVVEADGGTDHFRDLEAYIASRSVGMRERGMHRRRIYRFDDGRGGVREVEVVRPMHNTEFCANCTRLRVTSGGMLKPCLMHNDGLVDVLAPIRTGASDDDLRELFIEAINNREPYWK